jgi:hypothetical protein
MKFKIIFALYSGFFSLSNSLFKRSVINIIQNKIADRGHHDNIDNLPTTEEQSLALPILEIVAVLEEESCEDYCIETKDDACGNSYVDEQTEDPDYIDNLPTTEGQSLALPILEIVAVLEEESCEDYYIETNDDACGNSYVDEQTEDPDYYYY